MENAAILFKTAGALALVLGLLALTLYALKHWTKRFQSADNNLIEVISTAMIMHRKYVSVVRVGEQKFVIGVTDTNISLLGVLEDAFSKRLDAASSTPSKEYVSQDHQKHAEVS